MARKVAVSELFDRLYPATQELSDRYRPARNQVLELLRILAREDGDDDDNSLNLDYYIDNSPVVVIGNALSDMVGQYPSAGRYIMTALDRSGISEPVFSWISDVNTSAGRLMHPVGHLLTDILIEYDRATRIPEIDFDLGPVEASVIPQDHLLIVFEEMITLAVFIERSTEFRASALTDADRTQFSIDVDLLKLCVKKFSAELGSGRRIADDVTIGSGNVYAVGRRIVDVLHRIISRTAEMNKFIKLWGRVRRDIPVHDSGLMRAIYTSARAIKQGPQKLALQARTIIDSLVALPPSAKGVALIGALAIITIGAGVALYYYSEDELEN